MDTKIVDGFTVAGLSIQATNDDTSKIGQLWQTFYEQIGSMLTESSNIYGVYTDYESDASGSFELVAASDTLADKHFEGKRLIDIPTGKYLVFRGKGELHQTIIKLWTEIWIYFNQKDSPHSRAYTTDFEWYKDNSEIEIYIAII